MARPTPHITRFAAALAAFLIVGCSGSRNRGGPTDPPPGGFIVIRSDPANNASLFLNQSVAFEFSHKVDGRSADFNAISFAVFDLIGKQLSENVNGTFRVTTRIGDSEPGRRLEFVPKFPTTDTFTDGGFKPGRRYIVNLLRGDHRRNVGLIDERGKGLETAFSLSFQTADGTTPSQLFRDTKPGGPRRTGFSVTPRDPQTGEAELNELGQVATEIRLMFDQPLNPHSSNVPVRVALDPQHRRSNDRGRIFLEYDDLKGSATWIPAVATLEENSLEGSTIVLRPLGILPNHAKVSVIVESTLEDMSGESNVQDAAYNRVFATFDTNSSYELRFDALVENFLNASNIDFSAAIVEPLADVRPGSIRASFDFGSGDTILDYEPNTREVVLDTDFTQITPKNGQPINVSNGIFRFRDVTIPRGVTVRGTGSNPMVWLVTRDFVVEGDLIVDGGDGARVNTLSSANFPVGGGSGNCNGGRGGNGSPNALDRSPRGENGYGPGGVANMGGRGGRINCANNACGIGSGGGGGTFFTQGDPYYKLKAIGQFVQPNGVGGYGCRSRTSTSLPGGSAGPFVFIDSFRDNDFWGAAVDLNRGRRITGELRTLQGGQGGGGGGDNAVNCSSNDPNFINDQKGGGGGAGGGVLVIKALGSIIIKKSGHISANGGNGGGGAAAGSSSLCGGGGAGSGGMIILMAGRVIDIDIHGETYANNDYDFPISADGGIGRLDSFGGGSSVTSKYPPKTVGEMNRRPSGGFGGLGIIQLMAPAGPNPGEDDFTNTILDDNIIIRDGASVKNGAFKQRYIGWRGMSDGSGQFVDDNGKLVKLGDNVGDIRPAPLLMPAPFGTKSRVVSRWIDLGAASRRMTVRGGDNNPRGVNVQPGLIIGDDFGPQFEFGAVEARPVGEAQGGYAKVVDDNLGGVVIDYPVIVADLDVASIQLRVPYRGQDAVRVTLRRSSTKLAAEHHRYSHYVARLTEKGATHGELRILGHTGDTLYLSMESATLPAMDSSSGRPIKLAVIEKFFDIYTNGVEGFSQTFRGRSTSAGTNQLIPRVNVRIRFAFHQDPSSGTAKRFPPRDGDYFANWNDAKKLTDLREGGYRFVKYDILFDTRYEWDRNRFPNLNGLSPKTPLPEIRRLVLPYRY